MIRRTFDPTELNSVANHPEVRPWLGGEGELDLTSLVMNPQNFTLMGSGGGFLLQRHDAGVYEVHSQFRPGTDAMASMREGLDYMFCRTDCERLVTQVPDDNRSAKGLAVAAGFRGEFHRKGAFRGPTWFYSLTIEQWISHTPALEKDGEWFHRQLEEAKELAGSSLPVHDHDPAHERAVGAAVRMFCAGNHHKAVKFYNRWAQFAGYAPIALVSTQPAVVDVKDAVVGFSDEKMEVLLCR